MFGRLFLDHPHSVGETYFEHQKHALSFAAALIWAGLACAVHAVFPRLCETAASDAVQRLHATLSRRRRAASLSLGAGAEHAR